MRNWSAAVFIGLTYFLALNFYATDSSCSALVIYRRRPKPKLVCHEEFDEEEFTGSGDSSGSAAPLSSEGGEDSTVLSSDAEHQHHLTTSKSITTTKKTRNSNSKPSTNRNIRSTENGPRNVQFFLPPTASTDTGLHEENSTPVSSSVSSTMATFLVLGSGGGEASEGKKSPVKMRRHQNVAGQQRGRVASSEVEPIIRIGLLEDIPPSNASKSRAKTEDAEDDLTHVEETDEEEEEEATFEIVGKNLTDYEKRSIRRKLTETCRALNLS